MKSENLIIEAASLVHEDWCNQEYEAFFNRARKIYLNGEKNIGDILRAACYKGDNKRNEIYIDVPFMEVYQSLANRCLTNFDSFMSLVKLGVIEIKRFVPRNLTDKEKKTKISKGDYKEESREENILNDFKYLSADSQKENLAAAISAYTVFEQLSKAGITIEQMCEDTEIRNLIGIGIHTDWMKRNPEHPNKSLMVSYSELDDWTKQQDLTVFDALLKVVKKHNFIIKKDSRNYSVPDYLKEEQQFLKSIAGVDVEAIDEKKDDEDKFIGLYVACKISDDFMNIEPFAQYDTMGKCLHKLLVFPERVLLYAKVDKDGNLVYYNAETDEKVKIRDESLPLYSYMTQSNAMTNILASSRLGQPYLLLEYLEKSGNMGWEEQILYEIYNQYGLIIPFDEFCEQKFGKKMGKISLKKAKIIIKILNLFVNNPITLSTVPEIAQQQLESLGYVSKNKSRKKN